MYKPEATVLPKELLQIIAFNVVVEAMCTGVPPYKNPVQGQEGSAPFNVYLMVVLVPPPRIDTSTGGEVRGAGGLNVGGSGGGVKVYVTLPGLEGVTFCLHPIAVITMGIPIP